MGITSFVGRVKRVIVTAVNAVLVLVFVILTVWALWTVWPTVERLIGGGCETDLCCRHCDTLVVLQTIDGDTFDTKLGRVRLYGADTPEAGEPCFRQATKRLVELARTTVRVESGPRTHDPYGRLLFYVYTEDGDSIDETLVGEGLALAWKQDGQHVDRLVGQEMDARRQGTGCLWSAAAPAQ